MSVDLILTSIIILAASGIPGLFLRPRSPWIGRLHAICILAGVCLGLAGAFTAFFLPDASLYVFPWPSIQGALVGVDPLSAFFLFPVFLVGGLGSVYGLEYWSPRAHIRTAARLRFFWGLILAGMTLLIISRHALSFLLGWETMALSAFFLVTTEDEKKDTRKAGLVYLIATHIGTLTLFAFFTFWREATGSFTLLPAAAGTLPAITVNILFLLALAGFCLKAGVMPLQFWLPGAHTNAPSHVSAILSGVMLKMGIYGIIRVVTLLPGISPFWGWTILLLGAASGILGVVFALAQHDLKRLLAYHSVENIGIILLGLGLAVLGRSYNKPDWIVLGMAGGLLHVWNHSLFKSLLFFASGSILHRTGTRQIDSLGGLAKAMPWTATAFLVGAAAICGLPPLNGFISEFFIYLGFFHSAESTERLVILALLGAPALAMIGALAVSCFVKVYGIIFLGTPRTEAAKSAREVPLTMIIPMLLLSGLCLIIGLFPIVTLPFLEKAIAVTERARPVTVLLGSLMPFGPLSAVMCASVLVLLASFSIITIYTRNRVRVNVTWDCGYARPGWRMQYTSASFARSLVLLFSRILKPVERKSPLSASFPDRARFSGHVDDPVLDRLLIPEFNEMRKRSRWFYRFQQGQTQSYILYVAVTLCILLAGEIPFKELFKILFSK